MIQLRHNRIDLALWPLREAEGRPLLLLHGLGERTLARRADAVAAHWPGPILGLDFTGHGASSVPAGGGYYCEVLIGDVDIVLEEIGPATLLGRGLGGYVALLAAGARPELVRGAIVADGPGLYGGGAEPSSPVLHRPDQDGTTPDPVALVELSIDIRPPDYARTFAWQATALSALDPAIAVSAANRPPWLLEVIDQPGVVVEPIDEALARFAAVS